MKLRCNHSYDLVAKHKIVNENLYKCLKCGVYLVHHIAIGTSYKTKKIDVNEWTFIKGAKQ